MQNFEGLLKAEGFKFGIVASRFNHLLVDRLIEGANTTSTPSSSHILISLSRSLGYLSKSSPSPN